MSLHVLVPSVMAWDIAWPSMLARGAFVSLLSIHHVACALQHLDVRASESFSHLGSPVAVREEEQSTYFPEGWIQNNVLAQAAVPEGWIQNTGVELDDDEAAEAEADAPPKKEGMSMLHGMREAQCIRALHDWRSSQTDVTRQPVIFYSPSMKIAYIRTNNIMSMVFMRWFRENFPDVQHAFGPKQVPPGMYSFTFTADPFLVAAVKFADAFNNASSSADEVEGEAGRRHDAKTISLGDMSHNFEHLDDPSEFSDDFLKTFSNTLSSMSEQDNLSPQAALLTDAEDDLLSFGDRQIKYIGHVETIEEDWNHIQEKSNLLARNYTSAPPVNGDRLRSLSKAMRDTKTQRSRLGQQLVLQVCHEWEVDFACLGYSKPEVCEKMSDTVAPAPEPGARPETSRRPAAQETSTQQEPDAGQEVPSRTEATSTKPEPALDPDAGQEAPSWAIPVADNSSEAAPQTWSRSWRKEVEKLKNSRVEVDPELNEGDSADDEEMFCYGGDGGCGSCLWTYESTGSLRHLHAWCRCCDSNETMGKGRMFLDLCSTEEASNMSQVIFDISKPVKTLEETEVDELMREAEAEPEDPGEAQAAQPAGQQSHQQQESQETQREGNGEQPARQDRAAEGQQQEHEFERVDVPQGWHLAQEGAFWSQASRGPLSDYWDQVPTV